MKVLLGTKIKLSRAGHSDLNNDPSDLILCTLVGIHPSDLHA